MRLLVWGQLLPWWRLLRVKRLPTLQSLSWKAGIWIHTKGLRVGGVFCISALFLMPAAFRGLAHIMHFPRMAAAPQERLARGRFFWPLASWLGFAGSRGRWRGRSGPSRP